MSEARTNRGPGRPRAGSEDKRARILAEALTVFAEKGYEGASLAAIARAADITKPGLLHHFGSKDELFVAVLDERDRLSEEFGFSPAGPDMRSVLDAFCGVVAANVEAIEGTALFTAMTGAVVTADHPAHAWFAGHLSRAVTTLASAFEHGKREGVLRSEAPSWALARSLVALSDGLQVQMLCARADAPGDEDGAEALDSRASDEPGRASPLPYDTDIAAEFRAAVDALVGAWLVKEPDATSSS